VQVKTSEIKIVLWLFVIIVITLSTVGFAGRADLQSSSLGTLMSGTRPAAPLLAEGTDEPLQAVHEPSAIETPPPPPPTIASPQPAGPPPNPAPASAALERRGQPRAESAPESLSGGVTSGPKCPLGRVAMVRGSDSEASEGGGFHAARKNGIHGAVDLNGSVGEAVFAVANGTVVVAGDWGNLGRTVILDHFDGGYTIYGHLHTVEVKANDNVVAGRMIGTIGYSGNAKNLRRKNLPPHLHFAYVRAFAGTGGRPAAPLATIKNSGEGLATVAGVLHPIRAVGFLKCWEDPAPAMKASTRSPVALP
jgi:murein DD-endopeptidase MepM/ murein hydrolase activator NlpD